MKRSLPLAAACLTAAFALPALSQEWSETQQGLSMLEVSADRALRQYQIDADPRGLTVSQLAEIYSILSSEEINDGQKGGRIEAIVARPGSEG